MRLIAQIAIFSMLITCASPAGQHGSGHIGGIAIGSQKGGGVGRTVRESHSHRSSYPYGYGYGGFFGYGEPFYESGYDGSAAPSGSNITVIYPPATPPTLAPPAHSVIHEYNHPEDYGASGERETRSVLYLIAFLDKNIHAAMTYWVDGATLFYVDKDHKEQRAPLESVDRDLSAQLNRERRVPFNLP